MRKASKSRRRVRQMRAVTVYTRMVLLFGYFQASGKWREWSYRMVSLRQAQKRVAEGGAAPIERFHEGTLRVVGYRATSPIRRERSSPTSLTRKTMTAAAMTPAEVEACGLRSELERFQLWPFIGDDWAACVRPRHTAAERVRAEMLLGGRRLESRAA